MRLPTLTKKRHPSVRWLYFSLMLFSISAKAETLHGECVITIITDQKYTLVHQFSYDSDKPNLSQGFNFSIPGLPYSCLHQVHDPSTGTWLRCNYQEDWWLSDRSSLKEEQPKQDLRVQHQGNFFAVQSICLGR